MSETDRDGRAERSERADGTNAHLQGVEDGCGCAEVWEHLSEERRGQDGD